MKKNHFYKTCFICIAFFASINTYGQTGICSNLFSNTHSNTQHTITLFSPTVLPAPGTYNLTVRYLDPNYAADPDGYNRTLTSPNAEVTTSNTSQIIITDDSLNFPVIVSGDPFSFDFPGTNGRIIFSNNSGSYYWLWGFDQNICGPLPVTLISFTAQLTSCNVVRLDWETADEYNLYGYYIEKSSTSTSWVTVGSVTPLNTSGNHIYEFFDRTPFNNNNYYRLKSVDFDGSATYSLIRFIRCASCTGTPPATPCSQYYVSGSSSVCTPTAFYLNGAGTTLNCLGLTPSWSVNPSNIATITAAGLVTPVGSGSATITATIPGCANIYTLPVYIGAPPVVTTTSVTKLQAYTRYFISISNPTGASTSYSWYSNGTYVGTGYSKDYFVYPNNSISYNVNQSTSCGVSSANGYLYYQAPSGGGGGGGGCELPFTIKQSPSSKTIVVGRPPCWTIPMRNGNSVVKNSAAQADDYELRLLDFQGTIKKDVNHVSLKSMYNFDIRGIAPGNYIIQVINKGATEFSQKLRIE
jgi:hypothetical protein